MNEPLTYELEYSLFLAEEEMFESLTHFTPYLQESYGLNVITEGVKETIINYLSRIAEAITKIWNKFREIFFSKKDREYLKEIGKKVNNGEFKKTIIKNFTNYNFDKFDTIQIVSFNYEGMKEVLEKKETFIQKYYPMIGTQLSIPEAMKKLCIVSKQDIECTQDLVSKMYEFCMTEYDNRIKNIEKDLESVNRSNKIIQNFLNTVVSTNEAFSILESLVMEDAPKTTAAPQPGSGNKGSGGDNKVSFEDDKKDEDIKEKKQRITKAVTNYTSVCTKILTEKMNNVKNCYYLYLKCLKHVIPNGKEEKKEDEKVQIKTSNDPTQIKTN